MADPSSSHPPSGSSTPNPRFQTQSHTTEDLLKEQTYGLVHLSDFRKRRAEALEQGDRSQSGTPGASGAATPDGRDPAAKAGFKKRKTGKGKGVGVRKGALSFGADDEEEQDSATSLSATPARSATPAADGSVPPTDSEEASDMSATVLKKRLKPHAAVANAPKAMTKSALARESQLKDQLRKEYSQIQEAVKATEFVLPFTFFDGKSSPGGTCRMKKGDHIWLFLERARKVGADMAGKGDRSKKDWARIGVDDLMLVRGDLIIPHHYDFHHFILNRAVGYDKQPILSYAAEPTPATPSHLLPATNSASHPSSTTPQRESDPANTFSTAASRAHQKAQQIPDADLEGASHDPSLTKVVDRRWYERNKHIYPASTWEEFDAARDYSKGVRKDTEGNAFFFGRR
ncbi:hypothetical protein LTR36_005490 [Oleoguttula mirabilis]|uniref:FAM50A/XAP5 C-terminal domain-containing protein n=1 Tax=Oleoguttula mirabilis TaxID=1507867 RepID=A0AAV9JEI3_9PEZI|nr:hypothetical protein LTR36_005490 [Oleoguttula mirabilis]